MNKKTLPPMPDFDAMKAKVDRELAEQKAEQTIVSRIPELQQLNANIDKSTTALINAMRAMESTIQQYQRAETKLDNAMDTISQKGNTVIATLNTMVKNLADTMTLKIQLRHEDWDKIKQLLDERNEQLRDKIQKEDGIYLGYYAQWFGIFFFFLGIGSFIYLLGLTVFKLRGWVG